MKIGIMSDSHDHMRNIQRAVEIFREREAAFALHLGDFVNPNSVRAMQGIKVTGIFGNNDGDKFRLIHAFDAIGGNVRGDFHELRIDGMRCACYHGTEPQLTTALIDSGTYDAVFYGHTHECRNEYKGKTLVVNPGTTHGFDVDATVVLFDSQTGKAEFIRI